MPTITLLPHPELCPDGRTLEVPSGSSLCTSLLQHGVAIEHACEMVAACATCHVYVRDGAAALATPDDEESDQLDHAWGLQSNSRLACCVRIKDADLTVEFPKHSRNLAREH